MTILKNLKLSRKLALIVGSFLLGFVAFGLISMSNLRTLEVNGPIYQRISQGKDLVGDILPPPEFIVELHLVAYEMALEQSSAKRSELVAAQKKLRADYEGRRAFWERSLADGAIKDTLIKRSGRPVAEYFAILDSEFLPAVQKGDLKAASDILAAKLNPKFLEHRKEIDSTVALVSDLNSRTEAEAAALTRRGTITLLLIGAICPFVALVLSVVVSRMIAGPIGQMREVAGQLAKGDTNQIIGHESRDEIGSLAQSLRDVVIYNQTIARACEALGRGDVTVGVEPKSDQDQLARNFTDAVSAIRGTIREMASGATNLAGAAEELSATSSELSSNSENTSAQAAAVSSAAEQISANIQTVAAGAQEMSGSIREIAGKSHEAAKVAGDGVNAAAEANRKIGKLNDSSQQIGQVIKVITTIAEQTHLLALNATIEAARAGEAGKGFAVVAGEVKELARETAKATEDISRKIEAIQSDTREAIEGIGEIGQIITRISDIQNTIATAVEEQTATTNEISRNVSDLATGNQEVSRNITGVASAARSSTEGAEYTNKAAAELARLASTMQTLVRQFELGGEDEPAPQEAPVAARPLAKPAESRASALVH